MAILVTGGTGYIGSHVVVELLASGFDDIVIVDNLSNSHASVVDKIQGIAGKKVVFVQCDICNRDALDKVFVAHKIDSVIHFAALKAVGESVNIPLWYYFNNVYGMIVLLDVMSVHGVKKLVFSSSAAVYGIPESAAVSETDATNPINPYGNTKLMCEKIVKDVAVADKEFCAINLRYFNPVGCHKSGIIGEDPKGKPNNLMPIVCNVASRKQAKLSVFGGDYPTVDGTCLRDYIHVVDLAKGHVCALKNLKNGVDDINLGTSNGISVLQIVNEFEKTNGIKIPYDIVDRRAGDPHTLVACADKAKQVLGWQASLTLTDMVRDQYLHACKESK